VGQHPQNEYERAVTFWLGRLGAAPKGPGLTFIFWPFETMVRVDLRTVTLDVPPQDVITRDNVSVKVNCRRLFPRDGASKEAITKVANYMYATSQLAQTTLRSVLGQATLERNSLRARETETKICRKSWTATRIVGHQDHRGRGEGREGHSRNKYC